MAGDQTAISNATRLSEIGFPEFTAKLISDTFDTLIAANMTQTQAYIELLQQVSKTLTEFINTTKDDIDGNQILQFLTKVAPNTDKTGTEAAQGGTLSPASAAALTNAVKIPDIETPTIESGAISDDTYKTILDAVASRIAADKYTLLKEMVKLGLLRIIVEKGLIETKLTFTTTGESYYQTQSSNYASSSFKLQAAAKTGGFLSRWINVSSSTDYTKVNVSTTNSTDRDTSGSQVQIYGSVRIEFKTDYLPLNQ